MDPVQDDYDMARRLGFREPPDAVSMSCLTYMGRIMELRNFIGMFFSLVKSSQAIKKQLDEAVGSEQMPGSAIWRTFNYHHADYEQLIGELVISRAIETFDLYLISILREIFVSKPEMLKSEGKIDVSEVIDLKNFEDIIARIVERKLHDLSYRPLNDLQAYIGKVTGISLFESRDIFDLVLVASEIRNLIAHNDCCINDIFRSRVKGADGITPFRKKERLIYPMNGFALPAIRWMELYFGLMRQSVESIVLANEIPGWHFIRDRSAG
jgi:hypothetical protein